MKDPPLASPAVRHASRGLVAGALFTLGLAPFGWWLLALIGAGVLALSLDRTGGWRDRLRLGIGTGLGFLAPGLWWMTEFTLPGWALALLLEAAIVALAVMAVPPGQAALALPATLVLADALRGRWPFGGVPIATVGQTQIGGPLLDVARVGGALVLAALVGLVGVALARASVKAWRPAGVAGALVVVLVVVGTIAPDGRSTGSQVVAVVQAGGERGTRAVNTDERLVFEAHLEASGDVPPGVDLIVWPEDVVDIDGDIGSSDEGRQLAALAQRARATLVAGVVSGDDTFINEAVAWRPDGNLVDRYEKNQRVPFGEYIPFRSLVEKVADVSAVPRDARVGRGPGLLRTPAGDLGVVISYEVFFARRARAAVRAGGEVLLVPTNATSYTTTQMPALELDAARLRAVETGRHVVQAAPTGFSGYVDERGRVRAHTDLGRREVLQRTVGTRTGWTIYTRVGDTPFVLLAAALLALAWWLRRRAPA